MAINVQLLVLEADHEAAKNDDPATTTVAEGGGGAPLMTKRRQSTADENLAMIRTQTAALVRVTGMRGFTQEDVKPYTWIHPLM